jgi:8-oxo-dGTP pyrophosphatase MutT (NUDIX family)
MDDNKIRPLVICIFSNNEKILVAECVDPANNELFYRPLGGAIEFGERSQDALRREIWEEIGEGIQNLSYLGMIENIFEFNKELGHEIVLVYDGAFINQDLYEREWISGYEEDDENLYFKSVWKTVDDFMILDNPPLYPDGLIQLLSQVKEGG